MDKFEDVMLFIAGLSESQPLVEHVYQLWVGKLTLGIRDGTIVDPLMDARSPGLLSAINEMLRELLPSTLDPLRNQQLHGNLSFLVTLVQQLQRESVVPLDWNPLHNSFINYYNHWEDDQFNRQRDTTPIFIPSRLYIFHCMKETIECNIQTAVESGRKSAECAIYIFNADKPTGNSLFAACCEMNRQQAVTDLKIQGLNCKNTKDNGNVPKNAEGDKTRKEVQRTNEAPNENVNTPKETTEHNDSTNEKRDLPSTRVFNINPNATTVSIYGCSLPVPFWDDVYQQVTQLKNPQYIELQEPITSEELPAKERVLSNMIELFLAHHQRELTLVLSNKLTSKFKQKWKDACAQTNVKIYFGIELHMAKMMKTYEENKRKMAETLATGREVNQELQKYIGDRKLDPEHPTVKKVTDEISVTPGVRALLDKTGDRQQNT